MFLIKIRNSKNKCVYIFRIKYFIFTFIYFLFIDFKKKYLFTHFQMLKIHVYY